MADPTIAYPGVTCETNNDTGIEEGRLDFYRLDIPTDALG